MKLTIIFIFCVFASVAQTKIVFRDGNSMTLNGTSIGTYVQPDFFDATITKKNILNYYKLDGDTLEISIYSEWPGKRMNKMNIYRINKNQIDKDYLSISEETNENGVVTEYDLAFTALDETKFKYKKYDIYSSIGQPTSFNVFSITCNQKEGLEKLIILLNH